MKNSVLSSIATFVFASGALASPTCDNLTGDWVNQNGSQLTISKVTAAGSLQGSYRSSSGTDGTSFPLLGWTNHAAPIEGSDNARVVAFSVNWGSNGSITSWSGVCSVNNGTPAISTLWHLVRSNSQYNWDHTHTNTAVFTPK